MQKMKIKILGSFEYRTEKNNFLNLRMQIFHATAYSFGNLF